MFDAHFHLLPEQVYKNASFYNESWGGLAGHLRAMDEAGVERAVVSYPTTDYHVRMGLSEVQAAQEYNDAVCAICGESGSRLSWLAAVPLTEPGEMSGELLRARKLGAAGLTVPTNGGGVYPDDARFRPFFAEVEQLGMPVFFHPTTMTPFGHGELRHPLITPVFQYAFDTSICMAKVLASGMLNELPGLKLVFASFGGVMPFMAGRFDRTYRMLLGRGIVGDMGGDPGELLRKVYVDTSGTTSPALLNLALEVFGEDNVLWGSDFPANRDISSSVLAVKDLGLSPLSIEKVLHNNLSSLLLI